MTESPKASLNSLPNRAGRQWHEETAPSLLLVPIALLLALLAGCRQDEVRASSDPPPIDIKAVVHPAQSMLVLAQIDGQVQDIGVQEGARIESGQPLAQLANPTVEREVAAARTQLAWIEARQRRKPASPRSGSLRSAESLEIAARILEVKQQRFEKMKDLRRSNDITVRELEHAEVEYLAALRDYNNERRAATMMPAGAQDDPALLRAEREKAQADERFATHRRSLLQITAPLSGIVTRVHVAKGQVVFPRDPIADISNVATLQVRGDVAPELQRFLRPGMRVDVKVYSVPPRAFADEIDYVIPMQSTGSASRAATVVVTIPNPDGSLQPNTQALITVKALR